MPSGIHISSITRYELGIGGVLVTRLVELCYTLRRPPGDVIEATLQAIRHALTHPDEEPEKWRAGTIWTGEEAKKVAAEYGKGWSLRELARATGLSYGTIRTMIKSTGMPLRSAAAGRAFLTSTTRP
jgi:hypothetical protein